MTKIQIVNKSLRVIGQGRLTLAQLTADSPETARIVNDVYDSIRDEVLEVHPWNFSQKRANLTQLGGEVTDWTDNGSDVWYATLTTAPASVTFNGIVGTEVASVVLCVAAYNWYFDSTNSLLYVYSTSDPDTAFDKVIAVIPEFEYQNAFELPTDCLRVVRMENDDAIFIVEGTRLLTNETEAKVLYIAQITTESLFKPSFIMAFAQRLAAEIAIPVTNSAKIAESALSTYLIKLREAKSMDGQKGTAKEIDEYKWEQSRG